MAKGTAILAVRIIGDASSAVQSLGNVDKAAGSSVSALDKASVASAVVLGAVVAVANKLEEAGEAASTANARIANITDSMGLMGDRAGVVTDRIVKAAETLALATGIDPNMIKQGAAALSTFEHVAKTADQAGGAFDRATVLSADLASAGFGSVESASVMLGKALNDPIVGLTALGRVGVQFTAEQKDQIAALVESGDMLAAQEIILGNVERQVGGTAEATANASDKMAVSWQLAQEELGLKLLPTFEKFRDLGMDAAGWLADNADAVLIVGAAIAIMAASVLAINAGLKVYAAVQTIATAAVWASNVAWLANPITWIVLAIVAAIALVIAIVVLWVDNWDYLSGQVAAGAAGIGEWFASIGRWASDTFGPLIDWIREAVEWFGRLFGAQQSVDSNAPAGFAGFSARPGDTPPPVEGLMRFAAPPSDPAPAMLRTGSPSLAPGLTEGLGRTAPAGITNHYEIVVNGALDADAVAEQLRRMLTRLGRREGTLSAAGVGR